MVKMVFIVEKRRAWCEKPCEFWEIQGGWKIMERIFDD